MFPNAKIKYFTNYFDTFIAVTKGLADGAFAFHSYEKILQESYPNLRSLATDMDVPIVAAFAASASEQLRKDFDDFVESSMKSGLVDSLKENGSMVIRAWMLLNFRIFRRGKLSSLLLMS